MTTQTITSSDMQLQRREGQVVAIISIVTKEVNNGRRYAGAKIVSRQTLVVPVSALADLTSTITDILTYQVTNTNNDYWDIHTEAKPHIGLYCHGLEPDIPDGYVRGYYTLPEARADNFHLRGDGHYSLWRYEDDPHDPKTLIESL